jgi:hypothetical protein
MNSQALKDYTKTFHCMPEAKKRKEEELALSVKPTKASCIEEN